MVLRKKKYEYEKGGYLFFYLRYLYFFFINKLKGID